jgi:hypothetical protein
MNKCGINGADCKFGRKITLDYICPKQEPPFVWIVVRMQKPTWDQIWDKK